MSKIELEVGKWYRRRDGEIVYCFAKNPVDVTYPFHLCCGDGSFETCTNNGDFCNDADDEDEDIVEHLPDCTGFSWEPPKPIEPPLGWRLLTDGETVCVGDMVWDDKGFWDDELLSSEQKIVGQKWNAKDHYPIARKILQLREGAWYERKDGEIVGPCVKRTDGLPCNDHHWVVGNASYLDNGTSIYNPFVNLVREVEPPKPPEPKYRAFKNAEEFAPFRDKWLVSVGTDAITGGFERVVSYDNFRVYVTIGETIGYWEYLAAMERFTFEDGTPFGVLDDGT